MKAAHAIMLAALVPAGINPSLLAQAAGLAVPVCGADGGVRQITIEPGEPVLPGSDATLCCAKGCHAGEKRKKSRAAA